MSYRPKPMNSFDASGAIYSIADLKIWTAKVTSSASNGSWSADISKAGFKSVLCVQATAQADTTSVNTIPLAVVRTYTTTRVSGWVLQSNSGMIVLGGAYNGMRFANASVQVFLTVIGA